MSLTSSNALKDEDSSRDLWPRCRFAGEVKRRFLPGLKAKVSMPQSG